MYQFFYPRFPPKPCCLSNILQAIPAYNTVVYPKKKVLTKVHYSYFVIFLSSNRLFFLWLTDKNILEPRPKNSSVYVRCGHQFARQTKKSRL
jgi:hypothetical protein